MTRLFQRWIKSSSLLVTLEFYYLKTFYTTADSARAPCYKFLILEKEETAVVCLAGVSHDDYSRGWSNHVYRWFLRLPTHQTSSNFTLFYKQIRVSRPITQQLWRLHSQSLKQVTQMISILTYMLPFSACWRMTRRVSAMGMPIVVSDILKDVPTPCCDLDPHRGYRKLQRWTTRYTNGAPSSFSSSWHYVWAGKSPQWWGRSIEMSDSQPHQS